MRTDPELADPIDSTGVPADAEGLPLEGLAPAHFGVVLVNPEIPMNTGAIGRLCVNVGASLDLIHPMGFEVSEKACRRAGLDYWPRLRVREHESWDAYRVASGAATGAAYGSASGAASPGARVWTLTTRSRRPIYSVEFKPGDQFVFGRESAGLPTEVLADIGEERALAIPMRPGERSINLSNAVAIVLYEAVRQAVVGGRLALDEKGRLIEPAADAAPGLCGREGEPAAGIVGPVH